jgi:mannose/fructose/N-acetylgalactosamine-specific phosphotransferase system component IIC
MLGFILFILMFFLVIGLIIISTVFGFIRSIFSFGKRTKQTQDSQSESYGQTTSKSKVFDNNEGEYVDYEEIK